MRDRVITWAIFVIYFGGLGLLRFEWGWGLVWWVLGGFLGMGFEYVDRLLYVVYTKPHEQLSEQVKHLFREGRYFQAMKVLQHRKTEQKQLTVKSILFMVAWVPVALFVVTSTASMLAMGFVMGAGLKLLLDIYEHWGEVDKLKQWMFWPIRRRVSDAELRVVVVGFSFFFVLISILSA